MNAINQKTISIGIFKLVLPLFVILLIQIAANAQTFQLGGSWTMYNDKNVKFDKEATVTQSGANLSINNGYGSNSTAVLNGNTLTTSDGLTGTISTDGTRITWNNKFIWTLRGAFQPANDLSGNWKMYGKDGLPYDKNAIITQNGTSVTMNNGYGEEATVNLVDSKLMVRTWRLNGTVSADGKRIDWSNGFYWTKNPAPTTTDSGKITRTITIKNNSAMGIYGSLINRVSYSDPSSKDDIKKHIVSTGELIAGRATTVGGESLFPINEDVELLISEENSLKPFFKVTLPKNKDLTTFCYEVTGSLYIPVVKTCDGTPTYESNYIAFKNESAFVADIRLTYYPLGGSTTKTAATDATLLGYSRKLYLPLDADTNRKMTFTVNMVAGSLAQSLFSKEVSLSDFDTVGSSCYKTWGAGMNPKASPCSLNPNARKIKFWNNSGYPATLSVTYYDKDQSGKDVGRTVATNKLELTQTETIEVPNGTSLTPIKIEFLNNNWSGNKTFSTMNASANFTGELCYKVEGTTFAPTAATCDDTVGDTSGKTRQIRFQNEAGYDAQMIVSYFVDEVINGQKLAMPKTLTTGMINGLGGKFRLVTIPKNTSKGMPINIVIQGSATVKGNDGIFATTLPGDFAASPQPCFKVWGTLFDPQGGKCNQ